MRRLHLLAYSSLVLGLTACGGGGGGDGTSGVSNARSPVPPQTPLAYSGSVAGATVDATTAGTVASNVIGSTGGALGSSMLAGVSVQADAGSEQPTGATGIARRLSQAMRADDVARARSSSAKTGASISQSIACDSGSISMSGSTNDSTGQGSASVDFVDCRTGADTLNGPATLTIRGYDAARGIVTDGTLNFTRVRLSGHGMSWDLSGSVRTQVSTGSATETITLEDVTVQDNNSTRMLRAVNLRFANQYDTVTPPSSFFTQSISGRIFDSATGYVDVSTETAPFTAPWGNLYYSTRTQVFPDWGIINLAGATGRVKVTALGVDLTKVEVDADGDGTYENNARVKWIDFGTSSSADLADSDGDGMHNSWESAKGVSNANDDSDSDGYTNIAEYRAGSEPATSGSIPGIQRHIWVTNVTDLAVDAGGMIQVFINSSSSGMLLDPVLGELTSTSFSGATAPGGAGNRTATDAQGRTFTLAPTANPRVWTITSSTGTSVTVDNVAGTDAGNLIRYGQRGLAFRTLGVNTPGYVYLIESRTLIP